MLQNPRNWSSKSILPTCQRGRRRGRTGGVKKRHTLCKYIDYKKRWAGQWCQRSASQCKAIRSAKPVVAFRESRRRGRALSIMFHYCGLWNKSSTWTWPSRLLLWWRQHDFNNNWSNFHSCIWGQKTHAFCTGMSTDAILDLEKWNWNDTIFI